MSLQQIHASICSLSLSPPLPDSLHLVLSLRLLLGVYLLAILLDEDGFN